MMRWQFTVMPMIGKTDAEVRALNHAAYLRLAERAPKPVAVSAAAQAMKDARSSAQWTAPERALPWPKVPR